MLNEENKDYMLNEEDDEVWCFWDENDEVYIIPW